MSIRGIAAVVGVERSKLASQLKARLILATCAVSPFAFAVVLRLQSSLPEDTLFGRSVKHSGFALPLLVLGFASLWALPVLTSIVGGDLFAAEDRYGTWAVLLTRSRTRSEVFIGKTLAALGFSVVSVATLAASSLVAGLLVIGAQPLIDLSGVLLLPAEAFLRVTTAWLSVLPPVFGFTGLAVLASIATRSSVAGVGLPVAVAMAMQLAELADGPEVARRLLITSGFGAWHGLLTDPQYYRPLVWETIVSAIYFIGCAIVAYRVMLRRDIGR